MGCRHLLLSARRLPSSWGSAEALLRTSTKERFEVYALGKSLGIYTDPELRDMERRPPLPVESDTDDTIIETTEVTE